MWMMYRIGVMNMKENSIGSVISVRNEVSVVEIIISFIFVWFFGLVEC